MDNDELFKQHKKYLDDIKKLHEELLRQIDSDIIKKRDLISYDEYEKYMKAYEQAINDRDDVFVLLERKCLDDSITRMAIELTRSKLKSKKTN